MDSSRPLSTSSCTSSSCLLSTLSPQVDWAGDRGRFLLAPFRPKELNPESWRDKDQFWREVVDSRMRLPDAPICFNAAALCRDLSLEDGTAPKGLGEVLHRMRAESRREIGNLDQVRVDVGLDRSSWAWRSAKSLTGALVHRVWPKSQNEDVDLVWMDNLEKRSSQILTQLVEGRHGDDLVHVGAFLLVPLDAVLQGPDFERMNDLEKQLCLSHLQNSQSISLGKFLGQDYVKVHEKKCAVTTLFTDTDRAILQLVHLTRVAEKEVADRRARQAEVHEKVLSALRDKDKSRAKQLLAREVRIRKDLERRNGTLDNLESMLAALVGAHEDREVARSLQAGAEALKAVLPSPSEVEEMVDDSRDALSRANEIAELVSRGDLHGDSLVIGEAELEEELDNLLREDLDDSVCEKFEVDLTIGDADKDMSKKSKSDKVKGSSPKASLIPS